MAFSIGTTRNISAGVLTAVCDTGQGIGTVCVLSAADKTHSVQAHMSKETIIVNSTSQLTLSSITPLVDRAVVLILAL